MAVGSRNTAVVEAPAAAEASGAVEDLAVVADLEMVVLDLDCLALGDWP